MILCWLLIVGAFFFCAFLFSQDHEGFYVPRVLAIFFLFLPVFPVNVVVNYLVNSPHCPYLHFTKPFFLWLPRLSDFRRFSLCIRGSEISRRSLKNPKHWSLIEFREFISPNFKKFVQSYIVLNYKENFNPNALSRRENIKCPISGKFKMFTDMWIYYGLEKIVVRSLNILWLQWRERHAIRQEFPQKFVHAQLVKNWLFRNLLLCVTFSTFPQPFPNNAAPLIPASH